MPSPTDGDIGTVAGIAASRPGDPARGDANLPALAVRETAAMPEMAKGRRPGLRVLIGSVGVLLLGLGLILWQPWVAALPEVVIERAAFAPVARVLAVNGRVAGEGAVDIRPLVSGRITALPLAEGDLVEVGAVLARIDGSAQAAIVRQAVAGLDAALVAQGAAQEALVRARALGGATSRVALEAALRAELTAGQEVRRMAAVLEQGRVALSLFTVTAPMAGTVTDLPVVPGQTVDPGSVLMTLADMNHLVVEAVVDETHALELRAGLAATMRPTGASAVLTGRVSRVAQEVDAATGGLLVTLLPDAALVAPIGLTVTANITIEDRAQAITVPRAAVVTDEAGTAVFVLEGKAAKRRAVSVIEWPAARLIVTEGLAPGDPVIADAAGLSDGVAVAVAVP